MQLKDAILEIMKEKARLEPVAEYPEGIDIPNILDQLKNKFNLYPTNFEIEEILLDCCNSGEIRKLIHSFAYVGEIK